MNPIVLAPASPEITALENENRALARQAAVSAGSAYAELGDSAGYESAAAIISFIFMPLEKSPTRRLSGRSTSLIYCANSA